MPDPIPCEWLSAATLAVESQPTGTPAAQVARAVLEAVVPMIRKAALDGAATRQMADGSAQYVKMPRKGDVVRTGKYGDVTVDHVIGYGKSLLVTDADGGQHAAIRAAGEKWLRIAQRGN